MKKSDDRKKKIDLKGKSDLRTAGKNRISVKETALLTDEGAGVAFLLAGSAKIEHAVG